MPRQLRISFAASEKPVQRRDRRTIGLALIGVGTVGTGTARVFVEHQREIERRLGCRLELKYVCSRSILRTTRLAYSPIIGVIWRKPILPPVRGGTSSALVTGGKCSAIRAWILRWSW